MEVTTLENTATVDQALAAIDRDGCVIIDNLASPAVMEEVEHDLEPYFRRTPNGEGYFVGYSTKRMGALVAKSRGCHDLILNPTVLGVMDAVLGPMCSSYHINLTQAIRICPGEVAQIFHNDDELFPFGDKRGQWMVNALWAYDDFTVENGATRVVPGSHREPIDREPPEDKVCYAAMKRGSVLIYLGSVLHSGGANRSNRPRTAITMSYALGWLRQAENQYLAVPPAVARTLPPRLQRLIGYSIHAPNLGWYEGQDPGVVLERGFVDALAAKDYMPPEVEAMLAERVKLIRSNAA